MSAVMWLPKLTTVLPQTAQASWPQIQQSLRQYFQNQEYGHYVPAVSEVQATVLSSVTTPNQVSRRYQCTVQLAEGRSVSWPFRCSEPRTPGPHPVVVWIDFGKQQLSLRVASDALISQGYAVVSVTHNDITRDQADCSGVACLSDELAVSADRRGGKLAMWAWAAQRLMDWIVASGRFDLNKTAVVGHSRLGKTALLVGLLDPRFKVVVANASGCCGASLFRGSQGESIKHIQTEFPYWFAPRFLSSDALPVYDQQLLLAAIAPRAVMLTCAVSDPYSDYRAEYQSLREARRLAAQHLVNWDRENFAFHLRPGGHALTVVDWRAIRAFLQRQFGDEG
ncbi:alpha/beta hydrolase family protein [Lacticaseibacillus jixiensis]|uniref:alpha/beta hydrolase family protein n=1 Tax=Lacticaseibacillus jixiensis TaxID=3231926 RepID=UPI0036F3753F